MIKEKWLFDTDVLVDFLRGTPQALNFLENLENNAIYHISTITVAELYVGVREGKERQILDQFVQEFQLVGLDEKTARQGGLYRRDFGKSHGVGLVDAIIAATVETLGARLITLNKKHYPMLEKITIPYQKKA